MEDYEDYEWRFRNRDSRDERKQDEERKEYLAKHPDGGLYADYMDDYLSKS